MTSTNAGASQDGSTEPWKKEPSLACYAFWSIVIGALAIVVPIAYVSDQGEALIGSATSFKALALSATFVAALASLLRLVAHNDSEKKNLDGFGKMLGLTSGVLAVCTGFLLFRVDIALALS